MTKKQFAEVMAYLSAATNQPMTKERADVYYDLFQEIPLETLRIAAKKVALAHAWNSFPSAAELYQAACETVMGQCEMPAMVAWAIARRVAANIDPDIQGPYWRNGKEHKSQTAAYMADVPLLVGKVIRQIGLHAIGKDNESVVRAHFTRAYEAAVNQHKKLALMPASLKREIEQSHAKQIGVVDECQSPASPGTRPRMEQELSERHESPQKRRPVQDLGTSRPGQAK